MGALLSDCGTYRYWLSRELDLPTKPVAGVCAFVMLNPSTADASNDDPTIRRCMAFARSWGYADLFVVNLFARRLTDPATLLEHPDPVGPQNDAFLRRVAELYPDDIIAAWGSPKRPRPEWYARARHVGALLRDAGARPQCLGVNADGNPKHPLYLAAATERRPWLPSELAA